MSEWTKMINPSLLPHIAVILPRSSLPAIRENWSSKLNSSSVEPSVGCFFIATSLKCHSINRWLIDSVLLWLEDAVTLRHLLGRRGNSRNAEVQVDHYVSELDGHAKRWLATNQQRKKRMYIYEGLRSIPTRDRIMISLSLFLTIALLALARGALAHCTYCQWFQVSFVSSMIHR